MDKDPLLEAFLAFLDAYVRTRGNVPIKKKTDTLEGSIKSMFPRLETSSNVIPSPS